MQSNRELLNTALAGEKISRPAYVVYDLFYNRWKLDWQKLFSLGLGVINHASLLEYEFPHLEVQENRVQKDGHTHRYVKWITDKGELTEWYIDYWRQEYFVKNPQDYLILARAYSDVKIRPSNEYYRQSEADLGDKGITFGQLGDIPAKSRSPFQRVQVDFAGLEKFSIDIAMQNPELLELIDVLTEFKLREFQCAAQTEATLIKLWENLSIETMGPSLYSKYLVSFYKKVFGILEGTDKKIVVHYDGNLKCIAEDIAALPIDGIDSLTPAPEGDMIIANARKMWPDKFLWMHPSLSWFSLGIDKLKENIRQMVSQAGLSRFCLEISEDLPPNWQQTIPAVLEVLKNG